MYDMYICGTAGLLMAFISRKKELSGLSLGILPQLEGDEEKPAKEIENNWPVKWEENQEESDLPEHN